MPTNHDGEKAGNVPERDEELEKFVREMILSELPENHVARHGFPLPALTMDGTAIMELVKRVAAFSARRSREKALESLQEGLFGLVDCQENEGMIRGYKAAISRLYNS